MTHKPRSYQLQDMVAAEWDAFQEAAVAALEFDSGVEIKVTVASSRKDQSGGRQSYTARSAIGAQALLVTLPRARNLYHVNGNGTLTKIHR